MDIGVFYFTTHYGIDIAELAQALDAARLGIDVSVCAFSAIIEPTAESLRLSLLLSFLMRRSGRA
ncbi:MAG TPA: hypothetical protein VKZ79_20485 [Alphaproteobacteria bacterium]|nr:hypothetical protein [Alphaproteobacteria bacterium]